MSTEMQLVFTTAAVTFSATTYFNMFTDWLIETRREARKEQERKRIEQRIENEARQYSQIAKNFLLSNPGSTVNMNSAEERSKAEWGVTNRYFEWADYYRLSIRLLPQ